MTPDERIAELEAQLEAARRRFREMCAEYERLLESDGRLVKMECGHRRDA